MPDRPFNIRDILKFSQKAINEATTGTHSQDLIYLMKIAVRGDGNAIHMYDSTGDLPNLLDDITDPEQVAYVKDQNNLYFSDTRYWKPLLKSVIDPKFQGSKYGFAMGGGLISSTTVEKYSFSSHTNAVDVNDLTTALNHTAGHSDTVNEDGYITGGTNPSLPSVNSDLIQKFSFISSSSVSNVGTLTENKARVSGVSDVTNSAGFTLGGQSGVITTVEKFNFSSSTSGSQHGGLSTNCEFGASSTDTTNGNGYIQYSSILDRFPFSSGTPASNIGSLANNIVEGTGNSSETHGYISGGVTPAGSNLIHKYSFSSSPVSVSEIGNLTTVRILASGTGGSSKQNGYTVGGNNSPGAGSTISSTEKLSFQNDLTGIAVANLTAAKHGSSGAQH